MNDRSALLTLAVRRGGAATSDAPTSGAEPGVGPPVLAGASVIAVVGVLLSLATLGIYYASDAARRYPY